LFQHLCLPKTLASAEINNLAADPMPALLLKDNPEGPHAGDLPNLEVKADGLGKASLLDQNVTLGQGQNSLFHEGGTSLVIHANADDYKTDPAGNSGARIACGVIEK
jgi:Cu-Zn family superoxide dismutase